MDHGGLGFSARDRMSEQPHRLVLRGLASHLEIPRLSSFAKIVCLRADDAFPVVWALFPTVTGDGPCKMGLRRRRGMRTALRREWRSAKHVRRSASRRFRSSVSLRTTRGAPSRRPTIFVPPVLCLRARSFSAVPPCWYWETSTPHSFLLNW